MSGVLLIQPTDLSGLNKANGGDFPTLRVVQRIDGRDPLVSMAARCRSMAISLRATIRR